MERASTGREYEYFLGQAAHYLTLRDLTHCREYGLRAQKCDPRKTSPADQILAVADVLLAARKRLRNGHLDYFSILQIRRSDSNDFQLIRGQFEKLSAILNPKDNGFAFSKDAFGLVRCAWTVLSHPEKKTRYESEIDEPEKSVESREKKGTETFWTLCPYCYCMYEYEKVYEEYCLRCQNCGRGFHGVAVNEPSKGVLVEEGDGKEQYYCCWAYFPLGYGMGNGKNVNTSENQNDSFEVKNSGQGNVGSSRRSEPRNVKTKAGRIITKNVKTVARNTKKIMGRGMRSRRNEMGGVGFKIGEEMTGVGEGGLEFYEGDDDVFVAIVDTP